jgi:hypothetical protein
MLTWQAARAAIKQAAVVPVLVAGLLLGGCSHGGGTAAATPARTNGTVTERAAAFCSFLTSVNKVAFQDATQYQRLQLLASIVPRLRARRASAPAAVATAFGLVMSAAEKAVAQGDLAPLATNRVAAAGTKLTGYCHARS